jgi:hypothetical protein
MVFIVFIVDSVGMVWLNYLAGKSNWVPFWHLQDCQRLGDNRSIRAGVSLKALFKIGRAYRGSMQVRFGRTLQSASR